MKRKNGKKKKKKAWTEVLIQIISLQYVMQNMQIYFFFKTVFPTPRGLKNWPGIQVINLKEKYIPKK